MSTTSASSMQQNASHIGVGATKDLEKTVATNETAGSPKVSQNISDETNVGSRVLVNQSLILILGYVSYC